MGGKRGEAQSVAFTSSEARSHAQESLHTTDPMVVGVKPRLALRKSGPGG
jgi:hypothetical protein